MAESGGNVEVDQELLLLQKQKSRPTVVIEEYFQDTQEVHSGVKTHYQIEDVSESII